MSCLGVACRFISRKLWVALHDGPLDEVMYGNDSDSILDTNNDLCSLLYKSMSGINGTYHDTLGVKIKK